jgi:hypothetical protein
LSGFWRLRPDGPVFGGAIFGVEASLRTAAWSRLESLVLTDDDGARVPVRRAGAAAFFIARRDSNWG